MTFDQLPANTTVFLDANTFVYAVLNHPTYGAACIALLDRVERQEVRGLTSAHVLSDTVHRVMTMEACDRFGWPVQGIANRLRRHPAEVRQLVVARRAVDEISLARGTVLPVTAQHVSQAVDLSRQVGLLAGDALIVAVMHDNNLTHRHPRRRLRPRSGHHSILPFLRRRRGSGREHGKRRALALSRRYSLRPSASSLIDPARERLRAWRWQMLEIETEVGRAWDRARAR